MLSLEKLLCSKRNFLEWVCSDLSIRKRQVSVLRRGARVTGMGESPVCAGGSHRGGRASALEGIYWTAYRGELGLDKRIEEF